ncbi:MAG: HAD-IA family hydrolase [Devosia sp.]|uniref:HAD-IA family hydrolase n=1 Tax=Devosia sp. TaxID=1871048 RepID=UPI0024C8418A|nr:HAD-IA family hydrolase [Devosia sp.]UYO00629.1 MAG: HAD-IA family hydrolase [Devosia sp.]
MTRAVLFDVDGVLINGYHSNPERVVPWDKNLLADTGVDPDRLRKEFVFETFVKKVVVGEMAFTDALEKHLPALGYKGSPMAFARYWLEKDSNLNQPVIDVVRKLRAAGDCRLFIATNQEHMRASWLWSVLKLGDLFDDIFYSARIGARKPDPRFYKFVDEKIGPDDRPPLFFDDTDAVVVGARKAGWEATLFDTVDDLTNHPWVKQRL